MRDNDEFLIAPPGAIVYSTGTQSIANNTITGMSATHEMFDNAGMHSTVTDTSKLVIPTTGVYDISTIVRYSANGTGHRYAECLVNGVTSYPFFWDNNPNGTNPTIANGTLSLVLNATDFVQVFVRQTSGSNLGVQLLQFKALWFSR